MKYKILLVIWVLGFVSCRTPQNLLYFQDIEQYKDGVELVPYEQTIKKDDRLQIIVSGPNAEITAPYNLVPTQGAGNGNGQLSYLVDVDGEISFPVLGNIKVEGMTRTQLAKYLTQRLTPFIDRVVVVVDYEGYKVTILGAVGSPGVYNFSEEKVSILQALAKAGDIKFNGRKDNVLLLREIDGKQMPIRVDLRSSKMFGEEYYFMEQNDVLYVEPTRSALIREEASTTLSFGTMLLSVVSTIVTTVLLFIKL